ncbi:hypothetical protein LTR17_004969 [Elasticomyces elasticus]|nr:hypothetical protein LTR17_004969 [Elasticomyces elasticus]
MSESEYERDRRELNDVLDECLAQGRDEAKARAAIVDPTIGMGQVGSGERWTVGNPQPQPLTYMLPTGEGGLQKRTIQFDVDFKDKRSVAKANNRREAAIRARNQDLANNVGAWWIQGDPDRWFVGQPQPHPLMFTVPAVGGGTEERRVDWKVDFTNKNSVARANARRAKIIRQLKLELGIDGLLRPSQPPYTAEHESFISTERQQYIDTHAHRMPHKDLTARFNAHFPGENRTQNSIGSCAKRLSRKASTPKDQVHGSEGEKGVVRQLGGIGIGAQEG